MSQRIHVSVPVSDLERSISFYAGLFSTDASKVREGYANFRLTEPPIHLALVANGENATPRGGVHHHGVEVASKEALAQWRARLDEAGLEYRVESNKVCCYALADKLWVDDPDGNPWELWVRTGDADTMVEPSADDACCVPATDADAEATAKKAAPGAAAGCCTPD